MRPSIRVTATDTMPEPPPSGFAFYIDYKKGEGPASRIFAATQQFILACERIDSELAKMIDYSIETAMVLEDVEAESIKSNLVQALMSIDDQALASGEWKRVIGKFLVDAKYLILQRCQDDMTAEDLQSLAGRDPPTSRKHGSAPYSHVLAQYEYSWRCLPIPMCTSLATYAS